MNVPPTTVLSKVVGQQHSATRHALQVRRGRYLASVIIAITILGSLTAHAYVRDHVDGKATYYLYWKTRSITWYMDNKGCDSVGLEGSVGSAKNAFFTWASPWCTDLYFQFGGLISNATSNLLLGDSAKPDAKNVIKWHTTWPPPGVEGISKDTIAITTLKYNADNGVILDADIDLDLDPRDQIYWTAAETGSGTVFDIQAVLTQEIGHILGLQPSKDPDSVMFSGIKQGYQTKRVLAKDDEDAICHIYPFQHVTPRGPGQPMPPPEISGTSGCSVTMGSDKQDGTFLPWILITLLMLGLRYRRDR